MSKSKRKFSLTKRQREKHHRWIVKELERIVAQEEGERPAKRRLASQKKEAQSAKPMNHASKYLSVLAVAAVLTLPLGCGTTGTVSPLLTPQAVQQEITATIEVALLASQFAGAVKIEPDIALGRDVICAATSKTNASPESVAIGLQKAGITNQVALGVINSAVGVISWAISLAPTNSATSYVAVLCPAFNTALGSTPAQRQNASQNLRGMSNLPPYVHLP